MRTARSCVAYAIAQFESTEITAFRVEDDGADGEGDGSLMPKRARRQSGEDVGFSSKRRHIRFAKPVRAMHGTQPPVARDSIMRISYRHIR